MTMDLTEKFLHCVDAQGSVDTLSLSTEWQEDHQKIVGVTKSLQALDNIINAEQKTVTLWQLTNEGEDMVSEGSHEAKVFLAVPENGIELNILMESVGANGKVGFSKAMSLGWISINKSEQKVYRKVQAIEDTVQRNLNQVKKDGGISLSSSDKNDLKKRKLLQEISLTSYLVTRGSSFTLQPKKLEADLTPDMISSGSWKTKEFKPYNFHAKGVDIPRGHLHPLMKVKAEFRQIFLEMGFTEMPTNRYVESSFWNFDALFQPQQHPARDMQDTFFVSDPGVTTEFPAGYLEKVKKVHSQGGYGSIGYNYDWKVEETQKNLLRTHTTSVSARMLYQLAQQDKFTPIKYFSIDKVFRNETLDATHLAEFHQIEGVVADYNLSLGDLMGMLKSFFMKLGLPQLKFKPAYNPYTEPSMEIFSHHPGLGEWVEVGNSGMFRPEMLRPMGLPSDVRVIAWGLSLERPTMIKYGIRNIRDLVGHKVDLNMVISNPICRLNKPCGDSPVVSTLKRRQEAVLAKLQNLYQQVMDLRSKWKQGVGKGPCRSHLNLTVFANPKQPPYSLPILLSWLSLTHQVKTNCYSHSSLSQPFSHNLLQFLSNTPTDNNDVLTLNLVWKEVPYVQLVINPMSPPLLRESTLVRYLSRLAGYGWGKGTIMEETLLDQIIDQVDTILLEEDTKKKDILLKDLDASLSNSHAYLMGAEFTIADLLLWSTLKQRDLLTSLPCKLGNWLQNCLSRQDIRGCFNL